MRSAGELARLLAKWLRQIGHIGADQVIAALQATSSQKSAQRGQNAALAGDAVGHDPVEGADAVGGDDGQAVAEIVDIADLAAAARKLGDLRAQHNGFHAVRIRKSVSVSASGRTRVFGRFTLALTLLTFWENRAFGEIG